MGEPTTMEQAAAEAAAVFRGIERRLLEEREAEARASRRRDRRVERAS